MISLAKCNRSCNVFGVLSIQICVPSKQNVNVKAFDMIIRINQEKNIGKTYFMWL